MNLPFAPPEKRVPQDNRRSLRRTSPDLAAYSWSGPDPHLNTVRDISSTGVFLLTRERWLPGDIISLTLQRSGPLEGNIERRVAVKARAVRIDESGVGLSFVLPEGMDLRLWDSPLMVSSRSYEPEDVLREFRVAETLAFTQRLCASAQEGFERLLREGLSNVRVLSATEIALRAERMLALAPNAERMRAIPHIVLQILEEGSWADSESDQQLWAGLFASSCTLDGCDDANLAFVSMLSQLTHTHTRLLTTACTRSAKVLAGEGRVSGRPVTLSAAELMHITGSRDLIRIHRDLELLADLGLAVVTVRTASFVEMDGTSIRPTPLGLELYARCNGHRGSTVDFYGVPTLPSPALENADEIAHAAAEQASV
ncbi:MAG TPA: PilZ domain-containing protein [Terracidiphilus sp.]|nr:PilZ domain-containing protein [Terracidiphilus sp.]